MVNFTDFIEQTDMVVFPGPLGSELHRRGYETKMPLWSASANEDAWDLVKAIHEDYFRVGADINITNTFTVTERRYKMIGRTKNDAREVVKRSVAAARESQKIVTDRPSFIGGSYSPLEQCFTPALVPPEHELREEHAQQVEWLKEEAVDFLIPETINHITEAQVTAQLASQSGLPYIMAFCVDAEGNLLDGTPISKAVEETNLPGCVGIALNCRPIDTLDGSYPYLEKSYDGPKGLYANGFGKPDKEIGWAIKENDDNIAKFVDVATRWKDSGVKFIGGCCGMSPAYIEAFIKSL